MKALVCELCGSNEFVKEDGFFVCQHCHTKYSPEEAKKIMVEGTVAVKVDNTASIDNYLKMAESAYESSNKKETEEYCNKIIEIEPTNYKAWLLKGRAAGWQSTIANLRIEEAVNCFSKAIDNAPEEETESIKKEVVSEVNNLTMALMRLSCDNFANYASDDNATNILNAVLTMRTATLSLLVKCGTSATDTSKQMATMINNSVMNAWNNKIYPDYIGTDGHPSVYALQAFIHRVGHCRTLLEAAINLSDDDDQADIQRYKNLIDITTREMNAFSYRYDGQWGWVKERSLSDENKQQRVNAIMEWHQKIKDIDPNYVIPEKPVPQSSGCYVATAVYGSYDCPEVWTLRRFRDYTLAETWYGRAFIHTYYAISPTLVKWFGKTIWFKNLWKPMLDSMVRDLQSKGVENTPYEDRKW